MAATSNAKSKSPESADSTLIFSLEPLKTGDHIESGAWPLHLTLQRWFDIPDQYRQAFTNALTNHVHTLDQIVVKGGAEGWFDETASTRVRRIIGNGALQVLRQDTTKLIRRYGGTPATLWSGKEYAPHVTFQDDKGIEADEEVTLSSLHLVRRDDHFNKTVEATFHLNKGSRSAPTTRF